MITLLLGIGLLGQGPAELVTTHVRQGAYVEALQVAEGAQSAERALLTTWVRHQAGDLTGALECARAGLIEHPDHTGLLEQGSWLAASLMRGDEAMMYARRLSATGSPAGSVLVADAASILANSDDVERSMSWVRWVLWGTALILGALGAYGGSGGVSPSAEA